MIPYLVCGAVVWVVALTLFDPPGYPRAPGAPVSSAPPVWALGALQALFWGVCLLVWSLS